MPRNMTGLSGVSFEARLAEGIVRENTRLCYGAGGFRGCVSMRLLSLVVAICFGPTGQALAQGPWSFAAAQGDRPAEALVCPFAAEDYLCLHVTCRSGALAWGLSASNGDFGDNTQLQIGVDGDMLGTVDLATAPHADGSSFAFEAPLDPDQHAAWLSAHMGGEIGTMIFTMGEDTGARGFTLKGSSRALSQVQSACSSRPAGGDASSGISEAAIIAEAEADCGMGLGADAGFVTRADLNGDGIEDLVLNYGLARCGGGYSYYCGSAGCLAAFWLATGPGAYVRAFTGNIYDFRLGDGGTITLSLHGSSCGGAGADTCERAFRFDGAELRPL